MHALYDGVVSFSSFELFLARMDFNSFRRKESAWGDVLIKKKLPLPLLPGGLPSGFPVVRIAGSRQEHFQNGDNGRDNDDKKRESN